MHFFQTFSRDLRYLFDTYKVFFNIWRLLAYLSWVCNNRKLWVLPSTWNRFSAYQLCLKNYQHQSWEDSHSDFLLFLRRKKLDETTTFNSPVTTSTTYQISMEMWVLLNKKIVTYIRCSITEAVVNALRGSQARMHQQFFSRMFGFLYAWMSHRNLRTRRRMHLCIQYDQNGQKQWR
jgi:hypothetical protein